ncbi:serine protease FAM111A-like [Poeciliopsis prolifica]|uniref:serine protease FAM111A-like n=1 Tax=Poeciliopsis prolifica TaxID=188132 RepID=UPI002413DB04|nr:serine protease FAM111A-like [Poeciliopsis prolifica]
MAPKKQKVAENQQDIKRFLLKPNDVPGSSSSTPRKRPEVSENEMNPISVKKERIEDGTAELDGHNHKFKVKFGSNGAEYMVYCKKQGTVLQTIKSEQPKEYNKYIMRTQKKISDENIIISSGKGNNSHIVATHFPCSCVKDEECLTITTSAKVVEKQPEEARPLLTGNYFVFFIDKEVGENTKTKKHLIFRCNRIPQKFRYFCVYGTKEMTVEDALRWDGRFVDGLTHFKLSDNESGDFTNSTEIVDNLHERKFQICLPRKRKTKATNPSQVVKEQNSTQKTSHDLQQENGSASTKELKTKETVTVLEHAKQKGVSIKAAIEELQIQIDLNEINEVLRNQIPKLKELMESRFPDRSFEETLKLKKENFGKIQDSFSEVHTVRNLLKLSESICLLIVEEKNNSDLTDLKKAVQGTGFVLFDNFVLTNAHLFKPWEKINDLGNYVNITAEFNFENKDKPGMKYQATLVGGTPDLDFALLELDQIPDLNELKEKHPGLLKKFGPVPEPVYDSGACIIGHPAGQVKKMDITCIIRKEQRDQAVEQNVASLQHVSLCSTKYNIKRDPVADNCVTYNSFMYHGSSGSPVFDAFGRVFGLHSGGFFYDEIIPGHSVLEFCYPLLDIFKKLLVALLKAGRMDLLWRIQVEAKGNPYLEEILESVGLMRIQTPCVENQGRTDGTGDETGNETGEQFVEEEMEIG